MAGIKIVHVRYKGPAPSVTALVSGEVQMTINDIGLLMPHGKTGKLRILAVTSAQPSALTPGLPTVAATGLPGYEAVGITGVWVPIRTAPAIVGRINQEIVRVLKAPDVKERFLGAGAGSVGNTPEQFGSLIRAEIAKISKVIKDSGIRGKE
jgi:tripartite-type tricarboxylate transporter receptor subunit TctC